MSNLPRFLLVLCLVSVGLVCRVSVTAQEPTQEVLPKPQPPFHGTIGRTVKGSKPDFPKGVEAPKEPDSYSEATY